MPLTRVLAKVVLFDSQDNVLLIRRSETDVRRPLQWDLPGGGVEDGEDIAAGAVRELFEEAGIQLQQGDIELVHADAAMRTVGNVCWLAFVGRTTKTDVVLSYEHDDFCWVSLSEAQKLVTYDIHNAMLLYIQKNKLIPV